MEYHNICCVPKYRKFLLWVGVFAFCMINFIMFAIISSSENATEVCDERLVPLSIFALAFNVVQVMIFIDSKKETKWSIAGKVLLMGPSVLFLVIFWSSFYSCIGQLPSKTLEVLFIVETAMAHINVFLVLYYFYYIYSHETDYIELID